MTASGRIAHSLICQRPMAPMMPPIPMASMVGTPLRHSRIASAGSARDGNLLIRHQATSVRRYAISSPSVTATRPSVALPK